MTSCQVKLSRQCSLHSEWKTNISIWQISTQTYLCQMAVAFSMRLYHDESRFVATINSTISNDSFFFLAAGNTFFYRCPTCAIPWIINLSNKILNCICIELWMSHGFTYRGGRWYSSYNNKSTTVLCRQELLTSHVLYLSLKDIVHTI